MPCVILISPLMKGQSTTRTQPNAPALPGPAATAPERGGAVAEFWTGSGCLILGRAVGRGGRAAATDSNGPLAARSDGGRTKSRPHIIAAHTHPPYPPSDTPQGRPLNTSKETMVRARGDWMDALGSLWPVGPGSIDSTEQRREGAGTPTPPPTSQPTPTPHIPTNSPTTPHTCTHPPSQSTTGATTGPLSRPAPPRGPGGKVTARCVSYWVLVF